MRTTRERLTIKSKNESDLILRHKAIYEFCCRYVTHKRVLDLGCGDGYGSYFLAKTAKEVVGVDINPQTIYNAKKVYKRKRLSFLVGDARFLPSFKPFDVIISLQVIEHIENESLYLDSITRVLKKNGMVILTTPNRKTRLKDKEKPWNPFHVREYSGNDFRKLLSNYFKEVDIQGLTATGEIYSFEIKRLVLRRSIAKFDPFGLYNIVPKEWSDHVLKVIKLILRKQKNVKKNISTKDFFVTNKEVDKSLDLIAICKNIPV